MLYCLRALLRNLLQRDAVERELDAELRATVDMLVAEKIRGGMSPDAARRAARLELGGIESVKDQVRVVRSGALMDTWLQDVRYAWRLLRRDRVFTLTAVLSLAIGIGATTTVFTVANGLLLRSAVAVTEPDRLVDIVRRQANGDPGIDEISYPDYLEIRKRTTTLAGVYAYQLELQEVSLRVTDSAERVFANVVSTNYFQVLGVPAMHGRVFGATDSEDAGASPVAVLSHRYWARRFNSDPSIVGRTVFLNGTAVAVVGVSREAFTGMTVVEPDLWIPTSMVGLPNAESGIPRLTSRESQWLLLGGRLNPEVTRARASAEIAAIGAALEREFPITYQYIPPGLQPHDLSFSWSAERSSPIPSGLRLVAAGFLVLLLAIVSVVLVIACANIAGLLLARATVRRREIALRAAIGAGRTRIVRQLLTETTMLFALGSVAGLLLARALTSLLVVLLPAFPLPVAVSAPLDGRVVVFALVLSLVAALLSGLAPALHASRADLRSALQADPSAPMDRLRLRNAFVVAQVAFSVLLALIAGILVRGFDAVASIDRGFDPRGVTIASVNLGMAGYTEASGPAFVRDLLDRVRSLPGVQVATAADHPPSAASMSFGALTVPGVEPPRGQPFFYPGWTIADAGYFATLRIPLIAGRDFTDEDRAGAEPVAILGEGAAKRFWPSREAVGQYVLIRSGNLNAPNPPATRVRIVGVVRDLKYGDPRSPAPLALYVPMRQRYSPSMAILARTTEGRSLAGDLRALISSTNPNLPVLAAQTLVSQQSGPVVGQLRIAATVAGSMGLVGLLLAAIGIYGVAAYAVSRRTREIGIRQALGATRGAIVALVSRQGMTLVAIGLAIGLLLGVAAGKVLSGPRMSTPPPSVALFAIVIGLFAAVGLAACYLPARRATQIGAMDALRYD
jgi:predicted permease